MVPARGVSYGVEAKRFGGRAGTRIAWSGTWKSHRMRALRCAPTLAIVLALPFAALAQHQPQQPPQPQQPQPQPQQPLTWNQLPRMVLERQFAGPLQDTIVQRWRDPVDGTVCYIYLPITAPHSPPTQSGYVQYGANTIGSISCAPPLQPPPRPATPAAPPANPPAKK